MKHNFFRFLFISIVSLLSVTFFAKPNSLSANAKITKTNRMSPTGSRERVSKQHILQKASLGIDYLKRQQKANGAIFPGPFSAFDIWESVNAALLLALWDDKIEDDLRPVVLKALNFVRRMESHNGLVIHGRYLKGAVCVETSAEYVRLLNAVYGPLDGSMRVKSAILRSQQQKNGVWTIQNPEIPKEWQSFPSVTAFVFRALLASDTPPNHFDGGLEFLKHSQNEEGHWGVSPYYYGTPFYAMAPVLEVLSHNPSKYGETLTRAKAYLTRSQRIDGSWYYKVGHFIGYPSAELQTALALLSCTRCNLGPRSNVFDKGIKWLIQKQKKDGSWDGGYFPYNDPRKIKKEDLYATTLALKVLYDYYSAF